MLMWTYSIGTNASSTFVCKFPAGPIVKETQIQEKKIYTLYKYLENNNTVQMTIYFKYLPKGRKRLNSPLPLFSCHPLQKQTTGRLVPLGTFTGTLWIC